MKPGATALSATATVATAAITLEDATIVEAVRLVEDEGPLDDEVALRQAALGMTAQRLGVVARARILGRRMGFDRTYERATAWAPWVLLALVVIVVTAGLSLAGGVTGTGDRRINIVIALVGLLGLHLVTLLLWLLGLLLPARALSSFQLSFGWLWLALSERVAGGRRGQGAVLTRAFLRLLSRARLLPWALGFVSHAVWSLSFAAVLAALLFALAFRSYTLVWESTILPPEFFQGAVRGLGTIPAWLGFPIPDARTVLAPVADAAGQRTWGLWLTGCVLVYGLLPRLALAMCCVGICVARRGALAPDWPQPYFQRLFARLDASAPREIVDADERPSSPLRTTGPAFAATGDATVAIAFELPDELAWPSGGTEAAATQRFRVDGSASSRRELFDAMAGLRPKHIDIGCHAASSPDRGTARFLQELSDRGAQCRLHLLGRSAQDEAARTRWREWLGAAGLARIALANDPPRPVVTA